MLKIISKEIPIDETIKEKIEFICRYNNIKYEIYNGYIHRIDKTNLSYVEPNKIIIKGNTFFIFNNSKDIFIKNLKSSIKISDFQNYIKNL